MEIEQGIAFSAISLSVVETVRLYREVAPSLADIRRAVPGDYETRQLLLDADILALIVVLVMGGSGVVLIRRWYPLLLGLAALMLLSAFYRSVAKSTNEGMY